MAHIFGFNEMEKHPAHLNLNQAQVGIYIELLNRDINKWEGALTRAKQYGYESNVKRDIKIQDIEQRIEIVSDMLAELMEQTAW